MRKLLASALLAGLVGTLLVAGPALSKTKSVEVDDDYFVHEGAPRTVTVHKGDKVEWEWEGSNPHNVTVKKGPVKFHSEDQTRGTHVGMDRDHASERDTRAGASRADAS
jgi:plastocyanin